MEKQLNEIYQAEIEALRQELHLTRNFIYREQQLKSNISAETTQMMIDEYIKNVKQENY
jgi:hypothetical protein